MMSYHRRKDGLWYVQYYLAGRQKRLYTTYGPDGRLQAQELDAKIKRGEMPRPRLGSDLTFFDIAQQYLDHQPLAPNTRQSIKNNLNLHAKPLFGHKPARSLSMADLLALDQRLQHRSVATRNWLKAYCRAVMGWAVKNDLVERNPFAKFKAAREAYGPDPPTVEEILSIKRNAPPHLQWAIECLCNLGCRPGPSELFAVKMSDVDFERGGVYLTRSKTGSRRRLQPVLPKFLETLQRLKEREPEREYLIEYKGHPVTSLKTAWNQAKRRVGITRRLRLYDLRHWFATSLLSSGRVDPKTAAELLGHSSPQITLKVYYHLLDDQTRRALEHLPDLGDDRDSRQGQ